jgi:hypothetical protein
VTRPDLPVPGPSEPRADQPRGLMYVEVDYPPDAVQEFHDWYNNEHILERAATPGIVTAQRYAALEAGARWLAVYQLDSPAVLESEAYLRCKGAGETAWTRRMALPSRANYRRTIYELLWSQAGNAGQPAPAAGPPGLFSLRLNVAPPADDAHLQALLAVPGLGDARLYRNCASPDQTLLLADLAGIWTVQSPEFRLAWNRLVANLIARSVTFERGVQVLILPSPTVEPARDGR